MHSLYRLFAPARRQLSQLNQLRQSIFAQQQQQRPRNLKLSRPRRPYSIMASSLGASASAVLYAAHVSSTDVVGAVPEDAADKKHHLKNGAGFDNPWPSWHQWQLLEILRLMGGRRLNGEGRTPDTTPPTVNVRKPEFLPGRTTDAPLRATWLGHACYYVEFPSGLRVLFDPVFSERCSPFSFMGPKRYTPKPCDVSDIPVIDAVVISHSHYDHLDHPTIMQIYKKHPNCHFFAPLGNHKWFVDSKIPAGQVTELDWWEERSFELTPSSPSPSPSPTATTIKATISALPCQHTSGRTPFDRAKTLWASWSVTSGGSSVYFAGDTGYRTVPRSLDPADDHTPETQGLYPSCPAFADIGRLRGPFDLGLIPIGAYDPRFIMSPMHADPFDAVSIFRDVRARRALGMHWGTWVLTEEDVLEPPRKLRDALARNGIAETGVFDVCDIGESREFGSHGPDDKTVDWESTAQPKL